MKKPENRSAQVLAAIIEDMRAALIARGAPACECGAVCVCFSAIPSADCLLHEGRTCACGRPAAVAGFADPLALPGAGVLARRSE